MNKYVVGENITFTHEITKTYCNRCNQEITNCSECNDSFGRRILPNLSHFEFSEYEYSEMIECKDGKHLCIRCLEKRALAKLEEKK